MSTSILVNDTTRVTVTFYDWISGTGTNPIDPSTVQGYIKDVNLVTLSTFAPTNTAVGVYTYDWVPTVIGSYYIEFKATYPDATTDIVRDLFSVVAGNISSSPSILAEDQYILFTGELSPQYLDSEEITLAYPDVTPIEASEFIRIASLEVQDWLDLNDEEEPPVYAVEYVRASALCALSRLYDVNAGFGDAITLGDLEVQNKTPYKAHTTRYNASNWCELAALLRDEMLRRSGKGPGIRAIQKGSAFPNPMPTRELGSPDQ